MVGPALDRLAIMGTVALHAVGSILAVLHSAGILRRIDRVGQESIGRIAGSRHLACHLVIIAVQPSSTHDRDDNHCSVQADQIAGQRRDSGPREFDRPGALAAAIGGPGLAIGGLAHRLHTDAILARQSTHITSKTKKRNRFNVLTGTLR